MDYTAWEGRYQVLLAHLETVHQQWPKEGDLAQYEAKYYTFDNVVAKLEDMLACHEQARPGSMAEMPCHSEEAHLDSHLNVSTPPWRGATNTYATHKGNVYNRMPSKGKLALDEVGPARNHLGLGHPVTSEGDNLADPIQL